MPAAIDEPMARGPAAEEADPGTEPLPGYQAPDVPTMPSLLGPNVAPIDLGTALSLAGVQNPELNVARQRVVEAVALRQLAVAQFLPTINAGTNYDTHTGVLQQSNGNILSVNRSAVYVGAGTNAVAAGTVNIPGVAYIGNPGSAMYAFLASRQEVVARQFANLAVRNQVFLEVTLAYSELLRAEGQLAVAVQARDQAREVAKLTASYAATGEGREADAARAAAELAQREAAVQQFEGAVLTNSAALCRVLNLDPSLRLHPTDAWVVPQQIVPPMVPLRELLAIALMQHPALGERRAVIREALLTLSGAKILPFSPNFIVGFSAGGFGGGSNLVRPFFGGFGARSDFDAVAYWSILNMGVGNVALIRTAQARLQVSRFQEITVLNRVRAEVAEAYALAHARFAQIATNESAVASGQHAFGRDFTRIKARAERDVLPIELLNSLRLLSSSRRQYVDAIVDYNRAQFQLYVALGQPPANTLARPVPTAGVVTSDGAIVPAAAAPVIPVPPVTNEPGAGAAPLGDQGRPAGPPGADEAPDRTARENPQSTTSR